MKKPRETETIEIPAEHMAFADRRIAAILRRACYDSNIVESATRSCYLQGLWDGVQLATEMPELVEELRAAREKRP